MPMPAALSVSEQAFAEAGADILFIDALESVEEMRAFCNLGGAAAKVPKVGATPFRCLHHSVGTRNDPECLCFSCRTKAKAVTENIAHAAMDSHGLIHTAVLSLSHPPSDGQHAGGWGQDTHPVPCRTGAHGVGGLMVGVHHLFASDWGREACINMCLKCPALLDAASLFALQVQAGGVPPVPAG